MSPDPVNTSPGQAAILRELDALHSTVRENRDAVRRDLTEQRVAVKEEMDDFRVEVTSNLAAILAEAKTTNGRLRKVEVVVGVFKAALVALGTATPFIIYFLGKGG